MVFFNISGSFIVSLLYEVVKQKHSNYEILSEGSEKMTLRDLRRNVSLTQEGVAAALMLSQTVVSKWETGKWAPAKKVRPTLAAMYRVPLPVLERCILETCGKEVPENE